MDTEEIIFKAKLTEGNVSVVLMKQSLPMVLGLISISLINIVDTFFVGKLGTNELAAMSFTFPVVALTGSIYLGLGNGVSSVIARAVGKGNKKEIQRLATDSLILSVIFAVLCMILGLLTIKPIFSMLGAAPVSIALISRYMNIWYWGIIFLAVPVVGNNVLRAAGNTLLPSIIMFIAFLVNTLLDPLFIFGLFGFPRLELQGAAYATLIARTITLVASLYLLYFKEKMITLEIPSLKELWTSWRSILHVGLPSMGAYMITPLSIAVVTAMIATFGVNAIASFGVSSRIEMFVIMIFAALSSIIGPFVGQNWSAGNYDRVNESLKKSFKFCIVWGFLSSIVLILFGGNLTSVFNSNPEVIKFSSLYFWIVPLSYGSLGTLMVMNSYYNALGMPFRSALVIFIKMVVLCLPMVYFGKMFFGLQGIFLAASLSNIITGLGLYYWNKRVKQY